MKKIQNLSNRDVPSIRTGGLYGRPVIYDRPVVYVRLITCERVYYTEMFCLHEMYAHMKLGQGQALPLRDFCRII